MVINRSALLIIISWIVLISSSYSLLVPQSSKHWGVNFGGSGTLGVSDPESGALLSPRMNGTVAVLYGKKKSYWRFEFENALTFSSTHNIAMQNADVPVQLPNFTANVVLPSISAAPVAANVQSAKISASLPNRVVVIPGSYSTLMQSSINVYLENSQSISGIYPYLGLGLGYALLVTDIDEALDILDRWRRSPSSMSFSTMSEVMENLQSIAYGNLAAQIMFGYKLQITNNFSTAFELRYLMFPKADPVFTRILGSVGPKVLSGNFRVNLGFTLAIGNVKN